MMHYLDLLIALSAGVLIGILVGRRTSADRLRCRELETELAGVRAGANRYREEVAAHFTTTSELVHGLTVQYRAVYDHLADGARTLCPERLMELAQSDSAQALLAARSVRTDVAPERHVEPAEPELAARDAADDFEVSARSQQTGAAPAAY